MLELYGKWGGRPRYVLEKAKEKSSQMELEAMIGSCIPGDVLKSTGEHRGEEMASDRCGLILRTFITSILFLQLSTRV